MRAICLHEHKIDHVAHIGPSAAAGIGTLLATQPERGLTLIGVDREDRGAEWAELVRTRLEEQEVPAATVERVLADLRFEQVDLLQGTQLADLVGGLEGPVVLYFALPRIFGL